MIMITSVASVLPILTAINAEYAKRVRPGWDDKVLADWNGLMIAALVNAGVILDRPGWLTLAARAFDFIAQQMVQNQRLGHSWRAGKLRVPGLASDFAAMIRAALALYEATAERTYLERALAWQSAFDVHYADPDTGGYYLSADDADDLLLRPHSTQDDATPNPNAVAAGNLVRLAVLSGDDRWRAQADRLIEGILSTAERNLFGHVALLNALDLRLRGAEIVVTGPDADRLAQAASEFRQLLCTEKKQDDKQDEPDERLEARPDPAVGIECAEEGTSVNGAGREGLRCHLGRPT